jgi:hypothetical protein
MKYKGKIMYPSILDHLTGNKLFYAAWSYKFLAHNSARRIQLKKEKNKRVK